MLANPLQVSKIYTLLSCFSSISLLLSFVSTIDDAHNPPASPFVYFITNHSIHPCYLIVDVGSYGPRTRSVLFTLTFKDFQAVFSPSPELFLHQSCHCVIMSLLLDSNPPMLGFQALPILSLLPHLLPRPIWSPTTLPGWHTPTLSTESRAPMG